MNIHERFNTKEEYITYFNRLIKIGNTAARDIWREEDRPKLEAFFKWSEGSGRNDPMTEEVKLSFDHYMKCKEKYADRDHEIRRIFSEFDIHQLCESFGFVITNDNAEEDDEGFIEDYEWELSSDFTYTFPLIVSAWVDADRDRIGKFQNICVDFISKSEFD